MKDLPFLRIALQSFWFMLPAVVANITPIILARFRFFENLAAPLSRKYLGENKTLRGLVFGILMGIVTIFIQFYFEGKTPALILFSYRMHDIFQTFILGLFLSVGILAMDMLKSFFKRKRGIPPGSKWFPFDWLDSWGALFLGFLIFIPPLHHILTILVVGPILHMILNRIGYFFRLKRVWW